MGVFVAVGVPLALANAAWGSDVKLEFLPYESLGMLARCGQPLRGGRDAPRELPRTYQVNWIGQPAPEICFESMAALAGSDFPVERGDTLMRLDWNRFREVFADKLSLRGGKLVFDQAKFGPDAVGNHPLVVEPNGPYEESIIQHSLKNRGREALGIRLFQSDGAESEVPICQVLACGGVSESRFFLGLIDGVPLPQDKIDAMISELAAKDRAPDLIDITHTHPVAQFRRESRTDRGKKLHIIFPFNSVDLEPIVELSRRHPTLKFRGRAVTPDGFNYSVTYLNGQRLVEAP
jgi:hypothetical protein